MSVIAFDLDGTLITAGTRQSWLLRAAARPYGIELDVEATWGRKRDGASNLQLLREQGIDEGTAARINAQWALHIESPYWLMLDVPFTDTAAVLATLGRRGHHSILITARGNERWMRQQIARLGLTRYFAAVHCSAPCHAVRQKAEVLSTHGAVWFAGDTESDHAAAQLAGVPFAAMSTGQRSRRYFVRRGVTTVYASLTEAVSPLLMQDP